MAAGMNEIEHMARLNGPFRNASTLNLQHKLREIEGRQANTSGKFASVRAANNRFHNAITRHLRLRSRATEEAARERRYAAMRAAANAGAAGTSAAPRIRAKITRRITTGSPLKKARRTRHARRH